MLTISLILAIVSCLIHSPKIEYINFEVLISLFNLMVAIKALEQLKILDKLAVAILNKCNNSRSISIILILLCFICSMFVTNDVALLTFVPITLVISKKHKWTWWIQSSCKQLRQTSAVAWCLWETHKIYTYILTMELSSSHF